MIDDENLIAIAKAMGALLMTGLKDMMKDFPLIGEVRGRGLMIGVELVKDQKTKAFASEETVKFMDLCKDRGLLVGKGGLMGNVVRLAPPLSINKDEVNSMLRIMSECFKALK